MTLNTILLDGAQGLIVIPLYFIAHVLGTMVLEGAILYWFKYDTFKKCVNAALAANIVSFIVGIFLFFTVHQVSADIAGEGNYEQQMWIKLIFLFVITLIVEFLVLRFKNRDFPGGKIVLPLLLGNVLTYIPIAIILLD